MKIELQIPSDRSWTIEAEEIALGMVFEGRLGGDGEKKTLLRIYDGMVNLDDFSETWRKEGGRGERWTLLVHDYEEHGILQVRPDPAPAAPEKATA